MKNSKKLVRKISVILVSVIALLLVTSIPAFAATDVPQIQVQLNPNFNANNTIRTIFNWLIGILAIAGVGIGGFHIVMGQINQDTKERNGGIITLIISLAVGGLMILLLNMILL